MVNLYTRLPAQYVRQQDNPDYDNHLLRLPMRGIVVGSSGSMKTNLVLELLRRMPNTFVNIDIVCKCADEPLYRYLKDQDTEGQIQFWEGNDVPDINEFINDGLNRLVVFDDRVLDEKAEQAKMAEYYVRGRKKNLSTLYLSQSYYGVPKIVRQNCNYIFLKKINGKRDLKSILREYDLGVTPAELEQLYLRATRNKPDFLLICLDEDPEHRFRLNFGISQ